MSEAVDPVPSATGMHLARVIADGVAEKTTQKPAMWLSQNAVDPLTGKPAISQAGAYELLNQPALGWKALPTIRGLAAVLGWTHDRIYIPNAIACGLDAPTSGPSTFGATLPRWADRLPPEFQANIREQIALAGKAYGLS